MIIYKKTLSAIDKIIANFVNSAASPYPFKQNVFDDSNLINKLRVLKQ